MSESPNAVIPRVDPDAQAGLADVTSTFPPAQGGRLARAQSVKADEHGDSRASPTPRPPRRDCRQRRFRLRSGDWVSVRQLRAEDAPALAAFVERLSALSRYRRFHSALPRLTEQMISYLTDIDHQDHEALVAVPPGVGGTIVGGARFIRDPAHPDAAEVAVVVADSWQRRGMGTLLLRRLARRAGEVGIHSVTGDILAENHPTMKLARRVGARSMDNHGSTVTTRMDIADWAVDDRDAGSPLRALIAAEVILVPQLVQPMMDLSVELIRTIVVPVSHLA
jgi:RimJ/RimL family protein N-acetyltransferase